ncbi:MAG: hypothetical protein IIC53_08680, partial [Proteobacteria bacterium]|nr:hypothetical protein [Pseudomonadota bacterium]
WTNTEPSQEIAGIEVYIDFDPTRLRVVDDDSIQDGVQIKPVLASLNTSVKNDADNATGNISFASPDIG